MSLLDDEDVLLKEELEQLKKYQYDKIKKFCYSHISGPLYDYIFEPRIYYSLNEADQFLKPNYKLKLEWDEKRYKYYFVPKDPEHLGIMDILYIKYIEDIPDYIRVKNIEFILHYGS